MSDSTVFDTPWLPALASHPWAYPALEVLHIVGIALLLGNLLLVELRLWRLLAGSVPLDDLARAALRLALVGFALAALSGLAMFASQPGELWSNPAFRWKLVLLALAGLNAAWFHLRGGLCRQDRAARAQTLVSVGLWLGVLVGGRWIAYV
jgi:hypothetical protein